MQLTMFPCPGFKEDIETRIAAVSAAGFDAVALDFEKELEQTETPWENQLKLAEKYRLPVEQVHLTGEGMNGIWKDCAWGDTLCERTCLEIRRMRSLGLKKGVIHVTWGLERPQNEPSEIGLRRFETIADEAEKHGVTVALENSVFSEYVAYLLDRIDSAFIGLCYDSGHRNAFTPGFDYLSRYGHRLKATHLHDNQGEKDEHDIPFTGTVDWQETASALRKTAFGRETLTLECAKTADIPLNEWAARAYQSAVRLAEMIDNHGRK